MNELTDEVRQNVDDVLRVCQALIFRDIWKMTGTLRRKEESHEVQPASDHEPRVGAAS